MSGTMLSSDCSSGDIATKASTIRAIRSPSARWPSASVEQGWLRMVLLRVDCPRAWFHRLSPTGVLRWARSLPPQLTLRVSQRCRLPPEHLINKTFLPCARYLFVFLFLLNPIYFCQWNWRVDVTLSCNDRIVGVNDLLHRQMMFKL